MGLTCTPCIDGRLIPRSGAEAIQSGEFLDIPYMAGSTSDDIVPPVVFRMAKGWCRLQADQGRHPSYTWFFDRQLPGDDEGAWHSSDLWYWFGTLDNCWRPFTEKDRDLSREMTDYLTNFAKTGDPNGAGLPQWLPQQKGQNRVMRLGEKPTHMGGVNIAKLNQTMLNLFHRLTGKKFRLGYKNRYNSGVTAYRWEGSRYQVYAEDGTRLCDAVFRDGKVWEGYACLPVEEQKDDDWELMQAGTFRDGVFVDGTLQYIYRKKCGQI